MMTCTAQFFAPHEGASSLRSLLLNVEARFIPASFLFNFFLTSCSPLRKVETKSIFKSEGNQLCANTSGFLKSWDKNVLNSLYTSVTGKSLNILFIVYVSEKYANKTKKNGEKASFNKKSILCLLVLS